MKNLLPFAFLLLLFVQKPLFAQNCFADAGILTVNCNTIVPYQLDASNSDQTPGNNYVWTDATGQQFFGLMPEVSELNLPIILHITNDTTGCDVLDTLVVDDSGDVDAIILYPLVNTFDCTIASIGIAALCDSCGDDYTIGWYDGETLLSNEGEIIITEPGVYQLVVINNVSGCTDTDEITFYEDQEYPLVSITPEFPALTCAEPVVMLSADVVPDLPPFSVSLEWFDEEWNLLSTEENLAVTEPGEYWIVVTNLTNNCQNTTSIIVPENFNPIAGTIDVFLLSGETYMGQAFYSDTTLVDTIFNSDLDCEYYMVTNIYVDFSTTQEPNTFGNVKVLPNPVEDEFCVYFVMNKQAAVAFVLYDASGKEVLQEQENMSAGTQQKCFELAHLSGGVYYLSVNNGGAKRVFKIIKI